MSSTHESRKLNQIRLYLTKSDIKRLKLASVELDQSMSAFTKHVVEVGFNAITKPK